MPHQNQFLNLFDVVSPDFLKDLLNRFSEATDVKTLITDNLGKPLAWSECTPNLFSDFCARMRANPETSVECEKSDAFGGICAFHKRHPFIYRCPMNFVEVSVPIVINNHYLGVIMIGQVRVEEDEHHTLIETFPPIIDLDSDQELKELYKKTKNKLPLIPLDKLQALANMLYTIANYIAEISANNFLKDTNDRLNVRIQQEENYKMELENSLKKRELRSIEMNLKPQYIFDVLNTINNLVLLENPQRASEVISSLSKLMRYNLRNDDEISTVGEEFDSIQDYLKIRKISSEDRILIQTSVDEDCFNAVIPHFSIQPLVENAFTHGLETKPDGGEFHLEISKLGNKIKIVVTDNGIGIPPLPKSQLLALKESESELLSTASFTLINIIKILSHYFGDEFSWDVKSFDNQGTTIIIIIPYWLKEGGAINVG